MKRFVASALMVTIIGACSTREIDFQTASKADVQFYASFEQPAEDGTRVYANEDLLLRWTADDRVSIFNQFTYNQQYQFIGETGDYEGGFSKVDNPEFMTGDEIPHVISVYPFQRQTRVSEDEVITFDLPSEQSYAQNSFGLGANTMVSVSSGSRLKYRNVGGYLVVSLYGGGPFVSSITLKGNNGEKIAGKASITMPLNGTPAVTMANDATTEITLTCETPVPIGATAEDPTRFWFVVPPVTFEKGFTITIKDDMGRVFQKKTTKSITIERNSLSKMAPIEVDLPIPNYVIFYTSSDGEVVTPYNPDAFGASIVLNEYVDGHGVIMFDRNVTCLGERAFYKCNNLTSVFIPNSVTSIGNQVFYECRSLTGIAIPDGVISIGSYAFDSCLSLTSIIIPDSVTSIENHAFSHCYNLTDITLSNSLTSIGVQAFSSCYNLTGITIPNSVTSIEAGAFNYCFNLTSITIPDSVVSIGDGLLSGCTSLKYLRGKYVSADGLFLIYSGELNSVAYAAIEGDSVTIPDGVTSIGDGAFYGCSGLTSITIPDSVTSIGRSAFYNCSSLTGITIPNGVTNINDRTFNCCSSLTSITIPDSVTSIGDYAFAECTSLSGITIPGSVESMGYLAFGWCNRLTDLTISEGVKSIGEFTFQLCTSLSSVTIPGSVESIGEAAFIACDQLAELTISEGVKSIGGYAFQGCTSLSSVTIPDSVTSIGAGAFCLCSSLMSFNGKFASSDGLFLIDSGNLIQAANGAMVGHIDIPEGVTSIGDDSFSLCTGLTSISIPESVEGIGTYAFQECTGLTSVFIPGSVVSIGRNSFADCILLSEVTISEGVKSISNNVFAGCVGLQSITVLPVVPPAGADKMFNNTGSCPIYVRYGSLDAYKAANYWSEYADRIIGLDEHPNYKTLTIVDKDATPETKALFANLWAVAEKGWMFGHHDDLWYGRYWYNEPGKSDTKLVCGDYPAVFSVDFAEIMDNRYASDANAIRRRVILESRERGEVILACMHLNNPKTGGSSWLELEGDQVAAKKAVSEILTEGTDTRRRYLTWLDRCADFALSLKDSRGNLVPVIFRPFHEHTQSWSWWGTSGASDSQFIALWQLTIKYLRDTKGVHNFLYAVSPQMDANYGDGTKDRLLFRWPGDDWVDFIGMDCYHGTNDNAFQSNLDALEAVSLEKWKPCGVTEDGKESFTEVDFWSQHVLGPVGTHRISMVTMWRNKYVGNNESDKHYYSVYPGHPSEDDFRIMYANPRSLFSRDLPDMYTLPEGYEIK